MTVEIINGQPWKQQYSLNTTQTSDIVGWTTETSLPVGLAHSSAIVTKNRVYLLGGHVGAAQVSTIYSAPIDSSGNVGTWATVGDLPGPLEGSQAIITKNRVYLIGGVYLSYRATVYTAPIDENGIVGVWTTDASLPGVLGRSQAVVTKNRVYLLGGHTGAGSVATVYTAPISESGVIGAWTTATSLPGVLGAGQAIVTEKRVYLFGGGITVYTATIDDEGIIGAWSSTTSLPASRSYEQSVVTNSRTFLLGGLFTLGNEVVHTAPIDQDGIVGVWGTGTSLPGEFSASQVITTSSKIYLLGGLTGGSVATVYSAPFSGSYNDFLDKSWVIPPFWCNFSGQTEILT